MVDLTQKPFYLSAEQIDWVEKTIASMTLDEKIGQLFIQMAESREVEDIKAVLDEYHQGGLRYEGGTSDVIWQQNANYQENSKLPLLIAANCDNGGDGAAKNGTYISTAAGAAASGNPETAYKIGYVAGKEASAIGCNWLFNPCADIFMNWRNTIVNTRCYGDNANQVIKNIRAFIQGVHQSNMACCCKHFPGDGDEERDQHLVLGVNSLSVQDWNNSYRKVYQTMIDEGLESIMVGHIALPEMSRKLCPGIKDSEIMPATLAPELLTDLLRGEMGFNGLVLTDASHMAGFSCMERREIGVPKAIASGCDMFLYSNDKNEDFGYMKAGVENGMISEERLSDALRRILGLKAKLGLNTLREMGKLMPSVEGLSVIGCSEHLDMAAQAANDTITLVKDTRHDLPIRPETHKRARLYYIQSTPTSRAFTGDPVKQVVIEELQNAGFDVTVAPNFHDLEVKNGVTPENKAIMWEIGSHDQFKKDYDVVFVFINVRGYALENNVRIRWSSDHSNELPWYVTEVPTVGISLNYTTHLIDVPQIHTFVNAYGATRTAIRTALKKIMGESEWKGEPSETVFCGKWDTRL